MNIHDNATDKVVKMQDVSVLLNTIAPEMIQVLENRYNVLNVVNYLQPIGRRGLATKLNITERIIRKEANILKEQGLLDFSLEGMKLTELGVNALNLLKVFFHDFRGLEDLEKEIAKKLNIKKVIISSTADEDKALSIKDIGRVGAEYLKEIITDGSTIGITGGSSVYSVIENYKKEKKQYENLIVIPARGGLGNRSEVQANTLVEKFASKLNSEYKLLYTPDNLSKVSIELLKAEPEIGALIKLLDEIDILLFGVGNAFKMAKRRSLSDEEIAIIEEKGAVSEAFGYYFNEAGEIVHEISTVGISLDKFKSLKNLIAVAGGDDKAEAIISISKLNVNLVLVIDENIAKKIVNII